ncbi:MAG: branched-chain amino acid ABC transporter substrate-binding protein [Chloroflexia bacterium]
MKALRAISAALLFLTLAVLLPACGQPPAPTAVPTQVEITDEWGIVKIAPGEPIRIGFSAGLTGAGIDILGIDEKRGAELANADKPEVLGHKVELVVGDDMCNAEGGQTVANRFVADPTIVAVIGMMCSSACTPAAAIFEQHGYTMVSPSCTAPSLTAPGTAKKSFNRVCWNDVIQAAEAAKYIKNTLGLTKAATIHDGSPYGEQLVTEFAKNFEALGGQVVAREAVNVGDTDMRPVLTRIKSAPGGPPQVIYFGGFVAEGAYIAKQRFDVGLDQAIFFGCDGTYGPAFVEAAGAAAEGAYATVANPAEAGAGMAAFLDKYQAKYGEKPPAPFHAHAYDAYMLIVSAIEKVAKTDAQGNLVIGRKALSDAIRGTKGLQGLTGTISCNEYGDCGTGTVSFFVVKNGEFVQP